MSCRTTSGGSVSTSLARAFTGLEDKEIQHIFHALKREGEGMPAPSELDLAEWRDRQFGLVERAKRMSNSRREKLRSHLFRSRSEPVPDGATFYAWSRVEARARQEVAIRSITTAVDLEPPGSQAHLYEWGEDGRPQTVYYASYGSNLHRDRLLTYIKGGQPPGSTRVYDGCRDQSIPDEDIPIRFTGARPHFALTSRIWRGGIAFIDAQKGESAQALGRAYKVSIEQYDDIVAQENGGSAKTSTPVPLDEALTTGRSVTGDGPYETILHIGDYNGAPVLTFTAPFTTKDATTRHGHVRRSGVRMPVMTNKPSPAYIRMIGSGLGETFGMDEVAQADYIRGCPGGDRYSRQQLVKILRGEDVPSPTTSSTQHTHGSQGSQASRNLTGGESATTPTFVSPYGSQARAEARRRDTTTADDWDAQMAADGAVLAQLRDRGLFPDDDQPRNPRNPRGRGGMTRAELDEWARNGGGRPRRTSDDEDGPSIRVTKKATEATRVRTTTRTEQPTATTSAKTGSGDPSGKQPGGAKSGSKAARKRNRKNRTHTTTSNRSTGTPGTGTPAAPVAPNQRGTFARVKTYTCGEEQATGVRHWTKTVKDTRTELRKWEGVRDDTMHALGNRTNAPHLQQHLDTANQMITKTQTALAEAQTKLHAARSQQPATYYSPTDNRPRAAWKSEDTHVLLLQRTAEHGRDQALREIAGTERLRDEGKINDVAADNSLRAARGRLTRHTRDLNQAEQRLQEIYERIQAADN